MAFDEEKAYRELEEREVKSVEDNEQVKQLISSATSISKVIKVGKQEIRIRAFMPRSVRIKLLKTGTALKGAKNEAQITKIEEQVYPILASMCIDHPFNKAATWKHIDDKIGCAQNVLIDILQAVTVTDKQIESFR